MTKSDRITNQEWLLTFFNAEKVEKYSDSIWKITCKDSSYQKIHTADIVKKLEKKNLFLYAVYVNYPKDNKYGKLCFDIVEGLENLY